MKIRDIFETSTVSGSIGVLSKPLLTVTRQGSNLLSGKYTTDPTPNTPREYKRNKNVTGRFKNSPGH